jgi:arylsulfatase
LVFLLSAGAAPAKEDGKIVHDAEHNILKAQHGERWAKEDTEIDEKLAEIRKKNGGKPLSFDTHISPMRFLSLEFFV